MWGWTAEPPVSTFNKQDLLVLIISSCLAVPQFMARFPHGDIEKRPAWRRGNPSHIDIAPLHWQLVGPSTRLGTGTATSPLGPILRDSHDMTCVTCPCLSCFLICWEVSDLFPLWVRLRLSCACFNQISSCPKPRSFSVANLTCVKYVRMIGYPQYWHGLLWPAYVSKSSILIAHPCKRLQLLPWKFARSTSWNSISPSCWWIHILFGSASPFWMGKNRSLWLIHTHSLLAGIQYFESFIFVPVPAKINFWNVKSFIFASSSKFEQFQTIFWLFYVVLVGIPNHLWTSSSYFEHVSSILMEDVWQFFCFPGHLGE